MPQNLQWLSQQITSQTAANPAITDAQIIAAVNALRAANVPILISTFATAFLQLPSYANIKAITMDPALVSGLANGAQIMVACGSVIDLIDGNASWVDLTDTAVQEAYQLLSNTTMPGSNPAAMIFSVADYTVLLDIAQPLLANINGWPTGVGEADLTNARAWNAANLLTLQVQSGYNAAMALIVPGALPTPSALQSAFSAKVTG